ncbi:hypothetical protein C0993_008614 [Termitomyces sp. T159_Od127]|nr:hypothetical protein C0993_008614 [Termitomyces sp. T159_Od127]
MSAKTKRRPKRHPWSSDLDPISSNGQWSFGQILALIVVIPSAFSLAEAMNEHGVKRLSKRKKREHKKREDPELAGGN